MKCLYKCYMKTSTTIHSKCVLVYIILHFVSTYTCSMVCSATLI